VVIEIKMMKKFAKIVVLAERRIVTMQLPMRTEMLPLNGKT
jgi:hypothetical protein